MADANDKPTPNPANNNVFAKFYVEKESEGNIKLIDASGKAVLVQKIKAVNGVNTVELMGLNKFPNGVYIIQISINDLVISQKLVLWN